MSSEKVAKRSMKARKKRDKKKGMTLPVPEDRGELVILTGLSGSGKLSALKAFEDLGYYSVDNLPLELVPRFADLVRQSAEMQSRPPSLTLATLRRTNLARVPGPAPYRRPISPT